MVFNTGAALLDAIVLAVVSKEQQGTYGYKITQDVRQALEVSESTLYPVLRRLQKDGCLEVYDMQFDGRNRRYYKVTKRCIEKSGKAIQRRSARYLREVWTNEQSRIYDKTCIDASGHSSGRKTGSNEIL